MSDKKRREWWIANNTAMTYEDSIRIWMRERKITGEPTKAVEVLPTDPDPEWIDELIRLNKCLFVFSSTHDMRYVLGDIQNHLAKRDRQ